MPSHSRTVPSQPRRQFHAGGGVGVLLSVQVTPRSSGMSLGTILRRRTSSLRRSYHGNRPPLASDSLAAWTASSDGLASSATAIDANAAMHNTAGNTEQSVFFTHTVKALHPSPLT